MAGPVTSSLAPSVVAAEQRAREFLAQKQWRKARDELKPLTKMDRPRFLPLLIKANIGLSREMMAKGQVAEAQQVLSYLASIATSDQLRAVELEMTSQMEPTAGSADKLAGELAAANATRTESEKLGLADKLVLTFQELGDGVVADERVAAELRAVHEALLAASMQQWDRLPDILRLIPHRSVFGHWSAFIKGLAAFHTGESERAVRFFENLPSGTVPAKASQVYLLWLHPGAAVKGGRPPSEIVLEGAGRLLGQPGVGRLLLRADQLWKKEDHEQSYRVLRDALTGFPVRDLTWLGTLTDFYFNAAHTLPEADRDAYLEYFEDLVAGSATKNGIEEMLSYRLLAIEDDERGDWEGYLRLHERLYQPDPRFASLVYGRLGRSFASVEANPFRPGRAPEPVDGPAAVACLRKAIELDPNNLEAHLALVHVHTALRQARECNRLLDRMVERFPEEKRVLVDAAISCTDREAYVKGLDYLQRARRLDQLDPRIPDLIVLARHRLAEQSFRQKRPEKARESLAAAEPFLTDKPEDFRRSRWTARLHQALMELSWGDAAQGEKLLEEARAASPFPAAFLLFAHLAFRPTRSSGGDATPYWAELAKTVRSAPQVGRLGLLVRIIDHWQAAAGSNQLAATERLVRQCLPVACGQPFTREEARQMVELRLVDSRWRTDLVILVKKVLCSDPMDPLFRVYKFLLQGDSTAPSPQNRKELNTLLQEAGRRGDDATAQRIQHLIKRMENPPRRPLPPDLEMDDFDEDDLPPEFADPALNYPPLNLPPRFPRELAEIAKLLALMSDSELEGAKRTRPKGMPAAIFDSLVDLARGQQRPPRPKPGKQKNTPSGWVPPAASRDEEGPDQLNLL
jgi:tetratricopeptide (TPR) repeat protein